jgi:cob(I)alamin adenosyltransferase
LVKAMPTDKLFLRKVGKAMDEKDFELAMYKRRIELLEAELDRIQRTKRRKVEPDPNTQFANIETIRAVQRAVGRNLVEDSDSEEEGDSSDVESCIQVL